MDSEKVNWENEMTQGECFFTYQPRHSLGLEWDERCRGGGPER